MYTSLESIIEIVNLVKTVDHESIFEFLPGCGPITWHIKSNIDGIKKYTVLDLWTDGGRSRLRSHGIPGTGGISKELFCHFNQEHIKDLNILTGDYYNFDLSKYNDYDLYIFDFDQEKSCLQNSVYNIFKLLLSLFENLSKDTIIIFYSIKSKLFYNICIKYLMNIKYFEVIKETPNCFLVKKKNYENI